MTKSSSRRTHVNAFLLSAAIALSSSALAAQPWVSVPSTPNEKNQMIVNAGNLNPGNTVKLRITLPDGKISDQFLSVDSKGLLKLAYPLATPGRYAVEVFDKSGQLIGQGSLGHFR
ncbi:MAG: hypothetical protein JNK99_00085 [Candidatus Accumulibacter sp.]|uniref:hypothetical protein n=1 Tax=Accumulibacter sp. TaxID=2053492 RepID=UPI001A4E249C|nr:hypothetical protein [Accumulibacter sp.]MBL8393136.1 hypothetical protein [Accumulibacter sp.]